MTDLEILLLCAESMGLERHERRGSVVILDRGVIYNYDPLHDDGQAASLVKHHRIAVTYSGKGWTAHIYDNGGNSLGVCWNAPTWNRAVVTCVANKEVKLCHGWFDVSAFRG